MPSSASVPSTAVTDVPRDHRAVGGGSLAGRRDARGPRLVRRRQPAAVAHPRRSSSWPARRASHRPARPRRRARARTRPTCSRRSSAASGAGGHRVRIVFLDAPTDELVRRYDSTRRRHPLADETGSLLEAIERERRCSSRSRPRPTSSIDTTDLNVHQLHDRVLVDLFGGEAPARRHADDDRVVRLQARPAARRRHRARLPLPPEPALGRGPAPADRASTRPVRDYVLGQPETGRVPRAARRRCSTLLLPAYVPEGKSYLTSPSAAPAAGTARSSSPRSWPAGCAQHGYRAAWSCTATSTGERSVSVSEQGRPARPRET